ncbi:MAG: YggS family pyridoxal phosphate-dependent enzyme [Tahibacter sp.]
MTSCETAFITLQARISTAATQQPGTSVRLLAVSKLQPASAVRACSALGQRAFGENYVQEALAKQRDLSDLNLEWHLIGPLQSNKCRDVAEHFDWLQSLDRLKLIEPLAHFRPAQRAPLNVLIQVNIDDEASKSGCKPDLVPTLAAAICAQSRLRLRGLMAIPAPITALHTSGSAFRHMRSLYDLLKASYPQVDTLSMGMSDDLELAIAAGSTMVRVGSALFGARLPR